MIMLSLIVTLTFHDIAVGAYDSQRNEYGNKVHLEISKVDWGIEDYLTTFYCRLSYIRCNYDRVTTFMEF